MNLEAALSALAAGAPLDLLTVDLLNTDDNNTGSSAGAKYRYAVSKGAEIAAQNNVAVALEYYLAATCEAAEPHDREEALIALLRIASRSNAEGDAVTVARSLLGDVILEQIPPTSDLPWAIIRVLSLGERHLAGALNPTQLKIICEKVDAKGFVNRGDLAHDIERKITDDHTRRLADIVEAARAFGSVQPATLGALRESSESLIRAVREYAKLYSFPGQQREAYQAAVDVLRILSRVDMATDSLVSLRVAAGTALPLVTSSPSTIMSGVLRPILWKLHAVATSLLRDFVAQLEVGACRKRFPFHKTGSTLEAVFPVWNVGTGQARAIEIICTPATRQEGTVVADVTTHPDSLPPERQVARELVVTLKTSAPHDDVSLDFLLTWKNPDDSAGEATIQLTLLGQQWAKDQDCNCSPPANLRLPDSCLPA